MKIKILCGVSGSGKSTYIKNNFPNAEVCSGDHFFMVDGESTSSIRPSCRKHTASV